MPDVVVTDYRIPYCHYPKPVPNYRHRYYVIGRLPGGPTSNMLTYLAKGDLALSVSLTAVSSIISILTIPFIVQFALEEFSNESMAISVDAITMIKQLLVIVIIPVGIGMLIKINMKPLRTRWRSL